MAKVNTLPEILWPLMDGCTIDARYCVVCGRSDMPLNRHHVVRRGAGKLYRHGVEVPKPLLTLCGNGNTSGCHGLAHQNRLHFRWVTQPWPSAFNSGGWGVMTHGGHWEYIVCDEPTKYQTALEMDGWRPLRAYRL